MAKLMVEITRENAQRMLIEESRSRPVLIDFWADWCSPCKMLLPILEKLGASTPGQVLLAKVNCANCSPSRSSSGCAACPRGS